MLQSSLEAVKCNHMSDEKKKTLQYCITHVKIGSDLLSTRESGNPHNMLRYIHQAAQR